MRRIFLVGMLIVGSIVGAGFASGKELISFFGNNISPFIAVICGLAIFVLSVVFLTVGSNLNYTNIGDINRAMTGKFHLVVDIFLLFNSFIVFGGMLAGMDSLGALVFDIKHIYSIASGTLCTIIVIKGIDGIMNCNRFLIPIIVVVLIITCALKLNNEGSQLIHEPVLLRSALIALIYVCMNMMLSATALTTIGRLTKKEIIYSSLLASLVMSCLMLLLIYALSSSAYTQADLPLLQIAKSLSKPLFALVLLAIAIAIFTTMLVAMSGLCAWFSVIFRGKIFTAIVVLLAGLSLSYIGFSNVVYYLYPVMGVLGLIYATFGIIFVSKVNALAKPCAKSFKERNNPVHKSRKHAQNKS